MTQERKSNKDLYDLKTNVSTAYHSNFYKGSRL